MSKGTETPIPFRDKVFTRLELDKELEKNPITMGKLAEAINKKIDLLYRIHEIFRWLFFACFLWLVIWLTLLTFKVI